MTYTQAINAAVNRRPDYDDPAERDAWGEGWQDGYHGAKRNLNHPLPNAYNKGYWEGKADSDNR